MANFTTVFQTKNNSPVPTGIDNDPQKFLLGNTIIGDFNTSTTNGSGQGSLSAAEKNQIIWGGNYFLDYLPSTRGMLIWDKIQIFSGADFEFAWISFDTSAKAFRMSRVEAYGNINKIHPTEKPVDLYKFCLDKYAKQGDRILDTHLGSGSIAIACHDYGFDLTACELDKEYFDKAMERINNHTAQMKLF